MTDVRIEISDPNSPRRIGGLTTTQKLALHSLRDGKWHYGISVDGRNSLVSLHKRGLVDKHQKNSSATEWQITPEGLKILKQLGASDD